MFATLSASTSRPAPVRWVPLFPLLLALLLLPLVGSLPPVAAPLNVPLPATLPAPVRLSHFAQLGQANPAYRLHAAADGSLQAPTLAGLPLTLDATTLRLGEAQRTWAWTLSGWGRAATLTAPTGATPAVLQANQARFALNGIEAWYIAGPGGLEQGWTVAARPTGAGPLLLTFAEAGELRGDVMADGQGLRLRNAAGVSMLRYDRLLAFDATGRTLTARFTRQGDALAISVDDATATYPLTIDPVIEISRIDGNYVNEKIGSAIAMTPDTSTLVIGAPNSNGSAMGGGGLPTLARGAVYVHTGGSTTPVAKLTNSAGADGDNLGWAVAISADGNTIVAGAPYANGGIGRVYVYAKVSGSTWANSSTPTAILTVLDASGGVNPPKDLGFAVAVSSNGDTIVAGQPRDPSGGSNRGSVRIFVRSGATWADTNVPAVTLTNSAAVDYDLLGYAVALSGNDSTIIAGAPNNAGPPVNPGAAYVFVKPSTGWATSSTPTRRLSTSTLNFDGSAVVDSGVNGDQFGKAVTLNTDGSTIVVGVPNEGMCGSAQVFTRKIGDWTISSPPDATLTPSSCVNGMTFGSALALSGDGKTLVVGDPTTTKGTAYVFTKVAVDLWGTNNHPDTTLTPSSSGNGDSVGTSVALNTTGSTIVVGAPDSVAIAGYTWSGAVYTFEQHSVNLSNLVLTTATLNPSFTTNTLVYTATVANNVASITVTPTVSDTTSTVKVNNVAVASGSASGAIDLTVGDNPITVVVTALDHTTTKTYRITVRRRSANANLSNLTLNGWTFSPNFSPTTVTYAATVANNVLAIGVTPTVTDTTATINVNNSKVASGSSSNAIGLAVGDNTVTVVVTAEDGNTKTYTVTVTRTAGSSSANLSGLTLNGGTLSPGFAAGTTSYTAIVANSVTSVTVTPTVTDPTTVTIKVNGTTVASGSASGGINLTVGLNLITVVVTASDDSTNTYTIAVTRAGTAAIAVTQTYTPTALITTSNAITLTIVISSTGPDAVTGVVVTDNFPPAANGTSWTWTCVGTGGAICGTASGTGNLKLMLGLLPKDGSFTFIVTGALLNSRNWSNWFTVTTPTGVINTTTGNQSTLVGRVQMYLPFIQRIGRTRIYLPLVFPPLP